MPAPRNACQRLSHARMKTQVRRIMEREGCIKRTAVRGLLTDLRHYCEVEGINFRNAALGAMEEWQEERTTPL